MEEMHSGYENEVSEDTYEILKQMYNLICHENSIISDLLKQKVFQNIDIEIDIERLERPDIKLKTKIIYHRFCMLIEQLLKEYNDLSDSDKKEVINYYLFDNRFKELNWVGLGWYYDYKFKKSKATIYKGGTEVGNWQEKHKDFEKENGKGVAAVQSIVRTCRKHINIGREKEVVLHSYSKCFALDLFKYISLSDDNVADIYIKRSAEINIIKQRDETISIQQFILNELSISDCEFAFDFSTPRDDDRNNLFKWYKRFMPEEPSIQDEESDTDPRDEKSFYKYFYEMLMQKEKEKETETQISKMVSPVSDKEVVVSGDIWGKIEDYNENNYNNNEYADNEKCIHFCLDEDELYQLIFRYFQSLYLKEKDQINELDAFKSRYSEIIDEIEDSIQKIKEKTPDINPERLEEVKQKLESVRNIPLETCNPKIDAILSFIEWEHEKIAPSWSYKTIYDKRPNNSFINFYKCILVDTYNSSCSIGRE